MVKRLWAIQFNSDLNKAVVSHITLDLLRFVTSSIPKYKPVSLIDLIGFIYLKRLIQHT